MPFDISAATVEKMESFQQVLTDLHELLNFPINLEDPTDHDATLLGNQLAVSSICERYNQGDLPFDETVKRIESYLRSLKIYLENS